MNRMRLVLAALLASTLTGCIAQHSVSVQPVEVEPIHVTVDVNLQVDDPGTSRPEQPTPALGTSQPRSR